MNALERGASVTALLPAGARAGVDALMALAVALFGALVTAHGWTLVKRNLELEATTVPVPMAVLYAPLLVAGAVTCVQGLGEALGHLRGRRR